MEIETAPEFDKSVDKLRKKYRNIGRDLDTFKQVLENTHDDKGCVIGAERYSNLGSTIKPFVYKARKFYSTDLSSKEKFRIIYAFFPDRKRFLLLIIYSKIDYDKKQEEINKQIIYKYCQN